MNAEWRAGLKSICRVPRDRRSDNFLLSAKGDRFWSRRPFIFHFMHGAFSVRCFTLCRLLLASAAVRKDSRSSAAGAATTKFTKSDHYWCCQTIISHADKKIPGGLIFDTLASLTRTQLIEEIVNFGLKWIWCRLIIQSNFIWLDFCFRWVIPVGPNSHWVIGNVGIHLSIIILYRYSIASLSTYIVVRKATAIWVTTVWCKTCSVFTSKYFS